MRVRTLFLMASIPAAALLSATTAQSGPAAEVTTNSAPVEAGPIAKDTSKRVCRSRLPTGSRLPLRECRSAAEWAEQADKTQDELQRQFLNNSNRQQPDGSGQPQ